MLVIKEREHITIQPPTNGDRVLFLDYDTETLALKSDDEDNPIKYIAYTTVPYKRVFKAILNQEEEDDPEMIILETPSLSPAPTITRLGTGHYQLVVNAMTVQDKYVAFIGGRDIPHDSNFPVDFSLRRENDSYLEIYTKIYNPGTGEWDMDDELLNDTPISIECYYN